MLKYFKLAKEIIKQKNSPANIKVVINGTKKPALIWNAVMDKNHNFILYIQNIINITYM